MTRESDVTIIGGGWSGLLACKHLIEKGLEPIVLESRGTPGGVWRYSDDPAITTVMRGTRTTSSRGVTEIADFPMPDDYPSFPSHGQIVAYLDRYVEAFGLDEHLRCGATVVDARKENDQWQVVTADGETYLSRFLVVCSGLHSKPNLAAAETVFAGFSGEIVHSGTYKHPTAAQEGKRILVFGGGETASDIAYELSSVASEVHYAIPNGAWFLRRTFFSREGSDTLDAMSSPLRTIASRMDKGALFPLLMLTLLYGRQGHGQAAWRSPARYFEQFLNKSDDVFRAVENGRVRPRAKVTTCDGKKVSFSDGGTAEIDTVVLCTGYQRDFAFMPDHDTSIYRHYLFIFDNDDPSRALLGFARPVVTSIPLITEQQARLVAKVFSGEIRLPDKRVREREIERDVAAVKERYRRTSRRIEGLVDPHWYLGRVTSAAGTFPRFYELLLKHPLIFLKLFRLPAHGSIYLVNEAMNDPQRLERIVELMGRYRPRATQLRFYLDTCGGWLLVRVLEDLFRLFLRLSGQTHRFYSPRVAELER